jgi:hypothetical protein
MAKSSKPKEIVVVGSKIKETNNLPAGLMISIGDEFRGTLSWDVDQAASAANPPAGFLLSIFDDFEPHATLRLGSTALPEGLLTEDPLGITIGLNDNLPEVGDEVLVVFISGDSAGNHYQIELLLHDPSGTALDSAALTTPLGLALDDFASATLTFSEVGVRAPFATADVLALESFVVPEPAGIVLVASMLGTVVVGWLFRREA